MPPSESPDTVSATPVVRWQTAAPDPADLTTPLVVLLHGRGADELDVLRLADRLPVGPVYGALRAPIAEGAGYAWFANRGIGRPLPESLPTSTSWFRAWLGEVAGTQRPIVLVGFSGGATFAGGVVLADPARFAGLATMYATLPFDAGVPVTPGRLRGVAVLLIQGTTDRVIPVELQARTWAFLHDDSGATLVARRTPGGHQLTDDDIKALTAWIDGIVHTL